MPVSKGRCIAARMYIDCRGRPFPLGCWVMLARWLRPIAIDWEHREPQSRSVDLHDLSSRSFEILRILVSQGLQITVMSQAPMRPHPCMCLPSYTKFYEPMRPQSFARLRVSHGRERVTIGCRHQALHMYPCPILWLLRHSPPSTVDCERVS